MLENYQSERVKLMKEILPLFGENFILKGGTALSLFYGLNRYSEDLDFDCISSNMDFINRLKYHKEFKNWNINIKKKTDTVFRAMIDYGATSHYGSYPLKIEVSSRNKELLRSGGLKLTYFDEYNNEKTKRYEMSFRMKYKNEKGDQIVEPLKLKDGFWSFSTVKKTDISLEFVIYEI